MNSNYDRMSKSGSLIRMPLDALGELKFVSEINKSASDISDDLDTSRVELDNDDDDDYDCFDGQSANTSNNSYEKPAPSVNDHPFGQQPDVITVNGETGLWANKIDALNWQGTIPLTEYGINNDPNPEVIKRKPEHELVYNQEIAIRYLRPPTPPPPGEIIIKQESDIVTPAAPPLIIRQQPTRPQTPPPLVIRERPPKPPNLVDQKIITIPGKHLPPPPRKVVIERLPPIPMKPQSVIIEKWLPYKQQKRKVIFLRAKEPEKVDQKPKNLIIQWESPAVKVKKEFKDLGVFRADPNDYNAKFGSTLKHSNELSDFMEEIKARECKPVATDGKPVAFELDGDIEALSLVDLEKEGLSEYRSLLKKYESLPRPKPHFPFFGRSMSALGANDSALSDTEVVVPPRPTSSVHTFKTRFDSEKIIDEALKKIQANQHQSFKEPAGKCFV